MKLVLHHSGYLIDSDGGRRSYFGGKVDVFDTVEVDTFFVPKLMFMVKKVSSEEELLTPEESDKEGNEKPKYPEFRSKVDIANIEFKIGMLFNNAIEFKNFVSEYAVKGGYDVKFTKSETWKVQVNCSDGCEWKLYASKMTEENTLQIKTYKLTHTCNRTYKNRQVTSSFLASKYVNKFRTNPTWKINEFKDTMKDGCVVEVFKMKCYRAKKQALLQIEGTNAEQYTKQWDYAAELIRTNPGTRVYINHKCRAWTFITDQQKGLVPTLEEMCPEARDRSILTMLEWIGRALMGRLYKCSDKMIKYQRPICANIQTKIKKAKLKSGVWIPTWSGGAQFEVRYGVNGYVVNLENRTCTCFKWDLTGITYPHVVAVIFFQKERVKDYVHVAFKKETYLRTYEALINSLNGPDQWPKIGCDPLLPFKLKSPVGSPQKQRIRDLYEPKDPFRL
ncbi:uncharacterized protein LOC114283107 [Camellia sinensis]|uniref:uncharacterized protein LOC114283107 n=1 Tax=Camellia sinensis TaxID=4442 RepID=UPI001035CF7C|nr:uncharacterized protein LOC114283107 [Camellia sinensis]